MDTQEDMESKKEYIAKTENSLAKDYASSVASSKDTDQIHEERVKALESSTASSLVELSHHSDKRHWTG